MRLAPRIPYPSATDEISPGGVLLPPRFGEFVRPSQLGLWSISQGLINLGNCSLQLPALQGGLLVGGWRIAGNHGHA